MSGPHDRQPVKIVFLRIMALDVEGIVIASDVEPFRVGA